jgi:hypothetical protein
MSKIATRSSSAAPSYRFDIKCCNLNHVNWLNGKIIKMKLLNLKTGKKVSKEIISILMKKQLITVKSKYISENCVEYCKLKYMEHDQDEQESQLSLCTSMLSLVNNNL